jgi:hypothetical protein
MALFLGPNNFEFLGRKHSEAGTTVYKDGTPTKLN